MRRDLTIPAFSAVKAVVQKKTLPQSSQGNTDYQKKSFMLAALLAAPGKLETPSAFIKVFNVF